VTKLRVAFLIRGAVSKTSGAFGTDANPTDVVTENYVKNYMKEVLYSDNIGAGIHQEVLRKLYKFSYKKGHISESILTELGLTVREISNWS
jgi:hypothetical protein